MAWGFGAAPQGELGYWVVALAQAPPHACGTLSFEGPAKVTAVLGNPSGKRSFLFLSLQFLLVSSCPRHSTCPSGHKWTLKLPGGREFLDVRATKPGVLGT